MSEENFVIDFEYETNVVLYEVYRAIEKRIEKLAQQIDDPYALYDFAEMVFDNIELRVKPLIRKLITAKVLKRRDL